MAMKLREGNVFSHLCLCLSTEMGRGFYVTITHDTLDLTVQGPQSHPYPLEMGPQSIDL